MLQSAVRKFAQKAALTALWTVCIAGNWLAADTTLPPMLEGVGVEEKVGQQVDLNLTFIGTNGYPVPLSEFFHKGKPVIIDMVYYRCPQLCNLVLNAQTQVLREIPWTPGEEFEVVTISIDPFETFDLAQSKRAQYMLSYDRPAPGWHFMADTEGHAKQLASQLGFRYRFDERQGQFAHQAAIMLLTPEGKVSRYLYGIKFKARDVRLALTEAAEGRGKFTIDRLLLFCYHYDPATHSYTLFATNVMRAGGVLTVLLLGGFVWGFWRREERRRRMHMAAV